MAEFCNICFLSSLFYQNCLNYSPTHQLEICFKEIHVTLCISTFVFHWGFFHFKKVHFFSIRGAYRFLCRFIHLCMKIQTQQNSLPATTHNPAVSWVITVDQMLSIHNLWIVRDRSECGQPNSNSVDVNGTRWIDNNYWLQCFLTEVFDTKLLTTSRCW